jgi:hypothetical protein
VLLAPIILLGNSAILTTTVAPSTSSSVPIVYPGAAGLNLPQIVQPMQIRFFNTGASMVWVSFTSPAAGVAVIPTAGVGATIGTPQPVMWLAPSVDQTFTIPCSIAPLQGVAGTPIGFWLNHISVGASQAFQLQLGDGTS